MSQYPGQPMWVDAETRQAVPLERVNAFLQRVFIIMAAGLAITGVTAFGVASSPALVAAIFGTPLKWLVLFGPVIFALFFNAIIARTSYMGATIAFGAFSALMGMSLSSIFLVYSLGSIATTFFVTAGTFAGFALFGATTKRDLTKLGSILYMVIIGIVIASVVNIFLGSGLMSLIISVVGVVAFSLMTAFYMQQIIRMGMLEYGDVEEGQKAAIVGALTLYVTFINLFLSLLRLFGSRE